MEVGLTAKQIRKLSKGGYTDKQLAKQAGRRGCSASGDLWWENGFIVLFEGVPANVQPNDCLASKRVEFAQELGRMISRCKHEVYPVEFQGYDDYPINRQTRKRGEYRVLRFANGNGEGVSVDSKYAASILATKRVGKSKDPGVRWYTDSLGDLLMAVNGHRLGIICAVKIAREYHDWNFRYTGELPS